MNNSYLQEIIDEYIKQQLQDKQTGYDRSLGDFANKMNSYGSKFSKAGNIIGKKFANTGNKLSNIGNGMQNIGNTITDVQNIPTNFVNNLAGQGLQKVSDTLINKGVNNAVTNGLVNYGSQMAGSTAGTMGGNLASSLTGSTAGTTTAGATLGANTVAGTTGASIAGSAGAGAGVGGATAGAGASAGASAGAGASSATSVGAMAGPVGAIIGAIIGTAIMGANRKRAKGSASEQLVSTKQMAEQMSKGGLDEQEAQTSQTIANTNNLIEQQQQSSQDGIITGGASSLSGQDPYQTLKEYQDYLTNNGYDKNVINGVAQGLNSGNKEIDDWLKQYSNSAEAKANGFTIPTSEEDIANAKKLVQSGGTNFTVGTSKNFDQNKLINKLAKGFADFQTGYQDNRNNAFKPENLIQYEGEKKSIMQRFGEGAGTTTRLAQNPAVQGLIVGGLSTALTGNPLYGLGMANKFTGEKQTSDMYRNQLAQQGVNVDVGALGRLDSKDFNSLMTPSYRDAQIEMAKAKLAETEAWHKAYDKYRQDKLAQDKEFKTKDLSIKQQNADSTRIKANKTNGGKSSGAKTKSNKVENHPDWNKDLSDYYNFISNPKNATKVNIAKSRMIQKYGINPDKKLGL